MIHTLFILFHLIYLSAYVGRKYFVWYGRSVGGNMSPASAVDDDFHSVHATVCMYDFIKASGARMEIETNM